MTAVSEKFGTNNSDFNENVQRPFSFMNASRKMIAGIYSACSRIGTTKKGSEIEIPGLSGSCTPPPSEVCIASVETNRQKMENNSPTEIENYIATRTQTEKAAYDTALAKFTQATENLSSVEDALDLATDKWRLARQEYSQANDECVPGSTEISEPVKNNFLEAAANHKKISSDVVAKKMVYKRFQKTHADALQKYEISLAKAEKEYNPPFWQTWGGFFLQPVESNNLDDQ
jgi:hypothetical protein